MRAKAFILDMDGVLIDSNPLHAQAWLLYLSQYGKAADSMLERMHGKRNDQIVRGLFGEDLSEEEVFAHGAAKEALYRELMKPHVKEKLIPGVAGFLERHKAKPLGVASNAEPANVAFVLDEGGLRPYFSAVVDGHMVERPKPDPQIYVRTMAQLGVGAGECVIFEDSATGIAAARGAGARVVAVRSTEAWLPPTDFSIRDFGDPELERWLSES
ncbi:MAG: HAD-IA family hydrolase [Bryobacterales bacterium]|nr:HAD-IA family hydrolase [Bryobacterales bacterium]